VQIHSAQKEEKEMTQTQIFTDEIQAAMSDLDPGQLEHFYIMSCALLACYKTSSKRAVIVVHDERIEESKMIAVNADELQVSNMLNEMSELMMAQLSSGKQTPMQLN
jgi:hypothetical protein